MTDRHSLEADFKSTNMSEDEFVHLLKSQSARNALQEIVSEFMFEGSVPLHRRLEPLFSDLQVTRRHSPSE